MSTPTKQPPTFAGLTPSQIAPPSITTPHPTTPLPTPTSAIEASTLQAWLQNHNKSQPPATTSNPNLKPAFARPTFVPAPTAPAFVPQIKTPNTSHVKTPARATNSGSVLAPETLEDIVRGNGYAPIGKIDIFSAFARPTYLAAVPVKGEGVKGKVLKGSMGHVKSESLPANPTVSTFLKYSSPEPAGTPTSGSFSTHLKYASPATPSIAGNYSFESPLAKKNLRSSPLKDVFGSPTPAAFSQVDNLACTTPAPNPKPVPRLDIPTPTQYAPVTSPAAPTPPALPAALPATQPAQSIQSSPTPPLTSHLSLFELTHLTLLLCGTLNWDFFEDNLVSFPISAGGWKGFSLIYYQCCYLASLGQGVEYDIVNSLRERYGNGMGLEEWIGMMAGLVGDMLEFFAGGQEVGRMMMEVGLNGGDITPFVKLQCAGNGLVYPGGKGKTDGRILKLMQDASSSS